MKVPVVVSYYWFRLVTRGKSSRVANVSGDVDGVWW